jgi:preprotein translocase subunit SecF
MGMSVEDQLSAMTARNLRVEADKAWKTSWLRRGLIASITYVCAIVLLTMLGHDDVLKHALVPVMGYLLSTLSLPFVKAFWLKQQNRN